MAVFFFSNSIFFMMKKLICTIAAGALLSYSQAQQYDVYVENSCQSVDGSSVDISGNVHAETANIGDLVVVHFYFKNSSGSTKNVAVTRKKLCVPPEWSDGLCWGPTCTDPLFQGGCYTALQMTTNPWTSPYVTIENDSLGELISDVHVDATLGGGHYRYYFSTVSETLDSVDLKINGECTLGLDKNHPEIGLSVYPNPADDELIISTSGINGNQSLRITDLAGKTVYETIASDLHMIPVRNLINGAYLISILEKENILQTRRIIINH